MDSRLISSINHITLCHAHLRNAFHEYCDMRLDKLKEENKSISPEALLILELRHDQLFEEQGVMAVREAVVMAMMAVTMDEETDFSEMAANCINQAHQEETRERLAELGYLNPAQMGAFKSFYEGLRKTFFSRTCHLNQHVCEAAQIDKSLLRGRMEIFEKTCARTEIA